MWSSSSTAASLVALTLTTYSFAATIPDYVIDYAPLVYIDVNDPYLPSDIGAQVTNTNPELNFTRVNPAPSNLGLDNLSELNTAGRCDVDGFDNCNVFLTSTTNASTHPAWLYGVLPDPVTGETVGAKSCAVVVNDHGDGNNTVDAFYFYFYAFNLGENISTLVLGNHVGDWEHTMLRFVNGKPDTMWYSAHDSGFTYTYDAVPKNNSRPLVYASLGGHANYATPGLQSRDYGIVTLNDSTSTNGPLWDPVRSAYFYTFAPNASSPYAGTFTPQLDPRSSSMASAAAAALPPVDWLYFLGRWGDKQYPDSNPVQSNLAGISYAWESGPTGPLDKNLQRNGTCPKDPCTTSSTLPAVSGVTAPQMTIQRTEAPTAAASTTTRPAGSGSGSGTGSSTATATANAAADVIMVSKSRMTGTAVVAAAVIAWPWCWPL